MAKQKSTKVPPKKTAAPAKPPAPSGERDQLAALRADYPALPSSLAARLLAQHADSVCHQRGVSTRAADTFRGAMAWARTLHAHREALGPVLDPRRVRWSLDCLTALGDAIEGRTVSADPSAAAALQDAQYAASASYADATRRLREAVGSNATWTVDLDAALGDGAGTAPDVTRLRAVAAYAAARVNDPEGPPVELFGVDASFVATLEGAADGLAKALAAKPVARQIDRDSSAVNVAEGRLYFILRGIWDDLQAARDARKTDVLLTVTPTLLRGLGLRPAAAKPSEA